MSLSGGYSLILSSNGANATGSSHDFTTELRQSIQVGGNATVALVDAQVPFTVNNISAALGNNTFRYRNPDEEWRNLTVPDGLWTVPELNAWLASQIYENLDQIGSTEPFLYGVELGAEASTGRVYVVLTHNFHVQFQTIATTLGFTTNQTVTLQGRTYGGSRADLSNGASAYVINVSIVDPEYNSSGGGGANSLWSFQFDVEPSSVQLVRPPYPIQSRVSAGAFIRNIRVWLTDQRGISQDLNGEPFSLRLYLIP
jgi:hypothetical protein